MQDPVFPPSPLGEGWGGGTREALSLSCATSLSPNFVGANLLANGAGPQPRPNANEPDPSTHTLQLCVRQLQ